ncbi:hypothetical protein BU17DRAFT_9580, partial [Hysterangium stoloniferum]
SEGLALAPSGVVGQGGIMTDAEEERRRTGEKSRAYSTTSWERTPDEIKVCRKLEEISVEIGAEHITAVAIAYLLHVAPFVFPVSSGRKIEHLQANIEALDFTLTPAHIKALKDVLPFDVGFPHTMVGDGTVDTYLVAAAGHTDRWQQ